MGYLDSSDAILIALTRQRRAERREALKKRARTTVYYDTTTSQKRCPDDPRHEFWQRKRRERPLAGDQSESAMKEGSWWRTFEAQGGSCYLCGNPFTDDHWATDEHVVPRCLGGGNSRNLLLAHAGCNSWKGSRAPHPCELLYLESVILIKAALAMTFVNAEFATG